MTDYERAVRFERPSAIPMTFVVNYACWHHYPQAWLADLMAAHPYLFPGFVKPELPYTPPYPPVARKDEPYTDDFGCVWTTADDGITGTVTGHPLADWDDFASYRFPDPEVCMGIGPVDWAEEERRAAAVRAEGGFVSGGLRHGHTFLQLSDLRGYQNLLFDMTDEEPLLWKLIEGVEAFNMGIVRHWIALGADQVTYAEDLGMQRGPMLSPEQFRTYIKPSYRRLMKPALDSGRIVHMHSDGDIRTLADDLIEDGVQVVNLQDLVNGIDWIADRFRGRTCVELDLDRQLVTVSGTPADIDALVRREVAAVGTPEGGLAMIFGLYPGTPPENVEAVMDAMEKYAGYFR